MAKKKPVEAKGREPIQVSLTHVPSKFQGYHSRHFVVEFPPTVTGPEIQKVFEDMTFQFGRNDHVGFKHRRDISGFEIIIGDKADADTLGQIKGILERAIGLVVEYPSIVYLLDQMPRDPRYNK